MSWKGRYERGGSGGGGAGEGALGGGGMGRDHLGDVVRDGGGSRGSGLGVVREEVVWEEWSEWGALGGGRLGMGGLRRGDGEGGVLESWSGMG